jgi:hypothetical protein
MQQENDSTTGLVTPAEYARLRGLNRSTISRQIKTGTIPMHSGLIDPEEADRTRNSNLNMNKKRKPRAAAPVLDKTEVQQKIERICKALKIKGDPGVMLGIDKIQLEKLLLIERRQALQRENEIAEGNLLDAQQVESQWMRVAAVLKGRLLQIPGALSGKLVSIPDPQQIRSILEQEIREALAALSETNLDAE